MAKSRICKNCNAQEANDVPFPVWGLLCAKCYAAQERQRYQDKKASILPRKKQYYKDNKTQVVSRHARYHEANKEHINAQDRKEYAEKVKDKPPNPCSDCGAPMPKRARKYCTECKAKHDKEAARLGMQKLRRKAE